jgi:hypothetical protein
LAEAAPFVTGTGAVGWPITTVPFRIVKVTVPSLTVPDLLVTEALRETLWSVGLNVAVVL